MRSAPALRSQLGRLFLLAGLIVVAAVVAGTLSVLHLADDDRTMVDRVDPADQVVSQLLAGYLDQETGVRGYVLTGEALFLDPYRSGQAAVASAYRTLNQLVPPGGSAGRKLAAITAAGTAWERQFAQPAVTAVARGDGRFATTAELTTGKSLFDRVRTSVASLQAELGNERRAAKSNLAGSRDQLVTVMVISVAVILLVGLIIWVSLRRLIIQPIDEVAEDARTVASGDLTHEVRRVGPREIADLAADIEAMRVRIFAEVTEARQAREQLSALNADLARSNEDLEQFAYVASHDLQEPLRKVTSFCQLLEQRYGGQLDDRADQYIGFAVDGAKRMQVLINDLLAFSRIGRTTDVFQPVPLADCVDAATHNLAATIDATGGRVEVAGTLPTVPGDRTLLGALMQNLIGNGLKFHGSDPPVVQIAATPGDGEWLITVTDNGIGIEPRFAERIFVIFQRLHGRDAYTGTGIGLAMCRKIVEFHGGRIWLDTEHRPGTRFCLTLPPVASQEDHDELDPAAVHAG